MGLALELALALFASLGLALRRGHATWLFQLFDDGETGAENK